MLRARRPSQFFLHNASLTRVTGGSRHARPARGISCENEVATTARALIVLFDGVGWSSLARSYRARRRPSAVRRPGRASRELVGPSLTVHTDVPRDVATAREPVRGLSSPVSGRRAAGAASVAAPRKGAARASLAPAPQARARAGEETTNLQQLS
eukprot:COSAG03_NODE_140_length_11772_cov_5.105628_8_plen_155_part_00